MAELKIEKKSGMPHNLILEDRKKLVVSGVEDVDSFDEQTVVAYTAVGELMIKGEGLHINKLSLETGGADAGWRNCLLDLYGKPFQQRLFFSKLFR